MKLDAYLKQQRGRAAELARTLGVTPTVVSHWASGERPIPSERCPSIERATCAAVTCEELRGDVDWEVLRGTPKRSPPKPVAAMLEGARSQTEPDPDAERIVPVESA